MSRATPRTLVVLTLAARSRARVALAPRGAHVRRPWTWWLAWGIVAAHARDVRRRADDRARPSATRSRRSRTPGRRGRRCSSRSSAFATVGALVASRQPRNAVGWMFLGVALLVALSVLGGEYANYVFVENPGFLPGGYLAGWLYLWTWFPTLALIVAVPMVFPDGRVPGPRWRPVLRGWFVFVAGVVASVDGQARPDERPRRSRVARQPDRHRLPRPALRRARADLDARPARLPACARPRRRSSASAARAATSGSSSSG